MGFNPLSNNIMIVLRIIKGPQSGTSIVGPSESPDEMFASLLSTDSEWEIDYNDATRQEECDWLSKDIFNRCLRALRFRKLPVLIEGERFDDFEEFEEKKGHWFTNELRLEIENIGRGTAHTFHGYRASALSLVKDDETGVQIERQGYDEQYSIYNESIRERIEFRKKGLSEDRFLHFFLVDLLEKVSQGLNAEVDELLDYAEQFSCKMTRSFLTGILSVIIKQGTDRKLVWRIRELIRTAKS